jgi:hypothetical protein
MRREECGMHTVDSILHAYPWLALPVTVLFFAVVVLWICFPVFVLIGLSRIDSTLKKLLARSSEHAPQPVKSAQETRPVAGERPPTALAPPPSGRPVSSDLYGRGAR